MSDVEDIAADVAAEQAPAAAEPPAAYTELPDQKTVTAGSSRVVPSKAEAPAEAAVQTALGDQANAAEEVGAATAEEQEGKALAAEDRAAQSRVNQVDIEVEQRRREQALQAAQDQADAAEEKYRTYKIHDFFDDKSAGDRFVTKLFASIGAWGGGANPGLDELHRRMDMNFQRQRIGLMQSETFAKWKKEGVKDLQSRFEQENALLRLKQASATSAAADEAEAAQIRRGIPKAQAQANVTVTGLRTLAAKQKLEATQRLATTAHYASATTSGKVAPIKSGEARGLASVRQNQAFGNLAEAQKAIDDFKPGAVTPEVIAKVQGQRESAHAAEHTASSGTLGNLATRGLRAIGVVPRGELSGVPADQAKQITAAQQAITHLTELQQGKNIETLEQYYQRYYPYLPGLPIEEVRRRERALPELVAEQRAIQDPDNKAAARMRAAGLTPPGSKRKSLDDLAREHL